MSDAVLGSGKLVLFSGAETKEHMELFLIGACSRWKKPCTPLGTNV